MQFPGGYSDIQGQFIPHNGLINAWTNHEATNYYGIVHKSVAVMLRFFTVDVVLAQYLLSILPFLLPACLRPLP